ncbi:MAG: hypothetical protein ACYDCQ_06340 [Dehalococcoidia bacterium]
MGLMSKLFGKHESREEATPELAATVSCPHTTLTPRWDSAEDIGHDDRATGFRCEGCGTMFGPREAAELRDKAGDRLRETMPTT